MIQWEECSLEEATHVEINGEVYELKADGKVKKSYWAGHSLSWSKCSIDILIGLNDWKNISKEAFPVLGIKCLRMVKPTPSEFEATFVMYDGCWQTLHSLEDRFPDNCKKAKFRCVEILEEEE
jgi:hypothetical protein